MVKTEAVQKAIAVRVTRRMVLTPLVKDRILEVTIGGHNADDLIATCVMAMKHGLA